MNLLQKELKRHCRTTGARATAKAIGVSSDFVFKVLRGEKPPGRKMLAWLGLERTIGYRRIRSN